MPWTNGPMARSARDLELFFTTILDSKPWEDDPSCLKMPWRKDEVVWKGKNGMKVGVMWDDGVVRPQPPMRRAMSTVVEKLRKNGVEVVDYKPFRSAEAWNLIVSLSRMKICFLKLCRARSTLAMVGHGYGSWRAPLENRCFLLPNGSSHGTRKKEPPRISCRSVTTPVAGLLCRLI